MKDKDTVKETYTDEELALLLKKPGRDCDFCEYRNWVIINFLLNSGCRAATVRNIQNRDVDLGARQITLRHNKNGKIQVVPLCSVMVSILRDYMAVRQGNGPEYLFCNQFGEMLTENALRLAIAKYNRSRGVEKTSIHLFRHTFARKYLVDCGGDAFMLQKLLGHSTLLMTKHYCQIFDADIAKNYDRLSPLTQLNKHL
jgi:integrase/recombinase XerD